MARRTASDRVLELLWDERDELVDRIVARYQSGEEPGMEAYAELDPDTLREGVMANVESALTALREGRGPSEQELEVAALVAELRAQQGISLEAVLSAYRVAAREILVAVREPAVRIGLATDDALVLTAAVWDLVDAFMLRSAAAHRRVELQRARYDQQQRTNFLHGVLFGSLSADEVGVSAAAYGLEPQRPHHALRARPAEAMSIAELEQALHPSPWSPGLFGVLDGDLVGIVPAPPDVELPVAAGLGPALSLSDIDRSFFLASRALTTAIAFGRTGVVTLDQLSLRAAMLAEEHLGGLFDERYLRPLRELGAFGAELADTIRAYLEHATNIAAAARALHIHPNTLRHRLARFEEITGSDIRDPQTFVEVWWAFEREGALERGQAAPT